MHLRPRWTLSTKIFCLAFLNLLLLVVVFLVFMRVQFHLDIDSYVLSPVHDRVLSAARELALELGEEEPNEWNEVLQRLGRSHGVQFYLFDEHGAQIAGPKQPVPRKIAGEVMERSGLADQRRPPRPPQPEERAHSRRHPRGISDERPFLFRQTTTNPRRDWIGVRIHLPRRIDVDGILVAGTTSWRSIWFFFDPTPWLTVGAAVLLISVACWLPFVRGLTRSLSRVTRATSHIADGQFDVQLPVRRRDELGQLSDSINRMAARLAHFVTGQKRFLGDTAHELCSPIARIQVALGLLERSTGPEQQSSLADLREDVQHLSALVNELLSFSKASLKPADLALEPVSIAETVARILNREVSGASRITSSVDERLRALAHPDLLFRALSNVVRNAIRYAGDAGPIALSAEGADGKVTIRVSDCGPGLPEKDLETVFEPFYRLDSARERERGGVGLGLAIVKTCIESCQGGVHCRNREPSGLEVVITLKQA